MRILCLVVLLSLLSFTAQAAYTITTDGLYFTEFPTGSWNFTELHFTNCKKASPDLVYSSQSGGKGVILQECSASDGPYTRYVLRSLSVSPELWKPCKVTSIDSGTVSLVCPRLYTGPN